MSAQKIEDVLNAIADGVPIVWSELERAQDVPRNAFESLHLLQDVAHAFRTLEPTNGTQRPAPEFRWGTLDVEQLLGTGSFGEVWRAFDPWLGRSVALKLQRADMASVARRSEQLDEARRLAQIRHPNVLSCYGCAIHDGRAGLWSELIEGRTLAEVLADDGAMSVDEALRVGRDLARALAAVHSAGLVHGDIKAENVLREAGGRVVLMDFGAGGEERLLASRRLVAGTPAYLAPEVLDGAPLSKHSDIYALGVLIFLLLTGRLPYAGDTVGDLRKAQRERRHASLASLRPDLDARFVSVIERSLDADSMKRPKDAIEIAGALLPSHDGVASTDAARQRRLVWRAASIVFVAVCVALVVAWPRLFAPAWMADVAFVRTQDKTLERLADDAQVKPGDRLQLRLHSNRASYVYVLNEDANGNATVLYPLDGTTNALQAREETVLPGGSADATLAWEVSDDSTREEFLVIVALAPVRELDGMLTDWHHATQGPANATTRSVGNVVETAAPAFHGARLNGVLEHIGKSSEGARIWRFRFAHVQ